MNRSYGTAINLYISLFINQVDATASFKNIIYYNCIRFPNRMIIYSQATIQLSDSRSIFIGQTNSYIAISSLATADQHITFRSIVNLDTSKIVSLATQIYSPSTICCLSCMNQ